MTRARGASRPRFRLLPTLLFTLAILALPTAVYAWGRTSSSFDIAAVRVSGTHLLPAKKTLRILQKTYVGENLFTVTAADVRGALEPLSLVAAVAVDRDFPDTLVVTVTEYEPAAYALAGGRWYLLDENAFVVCTAADAAQQLGKAKTAKNATPSPRPSSSASSGEAAAGTAEGSTAAAGSTASASTAESAADVTARLVAGPANAVLPLPRLTVGTRLRPGAAVDDVATADMLRVITALPNSYRRKLSAVQDDGGQITLRFAGGPVAIWGDDRRTLAKTVALRTVLAEYAALGKTCTRIDVSIPDRTLAEPVLQ
jgi:cell division septal protein FtsQ